MSESGHILGKILQILRNAAKPGISLVELDALARNLCEKRHVAPSFLGYRGYPASACLSVNDVVVHGIPDAYKLKTGDILGVDMGVKYRGYHSDAAITMPVGNINDDKKRLISATKQALDTAIKFIKPGIKLGDLGYEISKIAQKNKLGVVKELSGHGIGRSLQEPPSILNYGNKRQGLELKRGMCLAIEPMFTLGDADIYLAKDGWTVKTKDGSASAHFEHTVVVTESGARILTS